MPPPQPLPQETAEVCIAQASARYHVPPLLIQSILTQEGGQLGQRVGPNRNGTYDLGPMQINTIWIEPLKEYGIFEQDLLWSPCVNIGVGVWILRKYYEHHDQDWTKAIMSYNAGFAIENGREYARTVLERWNNLHYGAR
nr:lytic transglycosylase domain-containing protein [Thioalkalivibrio thiocyanodenitrificans]